MFNLNYGPRTARDENATKQIYMKKTLEEEKRFVVVRLQVGRYDYPTTQPGP